MAYTEMDMSVAARLLESAGCAPLSSVEELSGGWANSNFLLDLEDGARLVLKIWDDRDLEEVVRLNKQLVTISSHGVPTPVPLMLEDGSRMMVVDGRAWILMPFVDAPWLAGDASAMRHLGELMARLHSIPDDGTFITRYTMGTDIWPDVFALADSRDAWSPFLREREADYARMPELIPDGLPRGVIHGDLFLDNVLSRDGEIKAVLDFEDICWNILATDLVVAFIGCCWHGGEPVEDRWNALLEGYESVRELTQAERDALPELYRYATLSVAMWRYRKFRLELASEEHADRYKLMTERLKIPLPFIGYQP